MRSVYLKFSFKLLQDHYQLNDHPTKFDFEVAILRLLRDLRKDTNRGRKIQYHGLISNILPTVDIYLDSYLHQTPSFANEKFGDVVVKLQLPSYLIKYLTPDGYLDRTTHPLLRSSIYNCTNILACYYVVNTTTVGIHYYNEFNPASIKLYNAKNPTTVSMAMLFYIAYLLNNASGRRKDSVTQIFILALSCVLIFYASDISYRSYQNIKLGTSINFSDDVFYARLPTDLLSSRQQLYDFATQEKLKELFISLFENETSLPLVLNEHNKTFVMNTLKDLSLPLSDGLFYGLQPHLYEEYLVTIHKMIFISNKSKSLNLVSKENEDKKSSVRSENRVVVYNNDGYLKDPDGIFENISLIKGKALTLGSTPIGYNILLPKGEIKNILVHVYGGNNKKFIDTKSFNPEAINEFADIFQDSAIVTLNTPDLLELTVPQMEMPMELHQKIQRCIDHFYETIHRAPQSLHQKLVVLKNKAIFLYGASFGGLIAVNHAEQYPNTYNGYISHNGGLIKNISHFDMPIVGPARSALGSYLDPSNDNKITDLNDPILVMQVLVDNNVNANVAFTFFEKAKQSKAEFVSLYVSQTGNLAPREEIFNKGHYFPENPDDKKHFFGAMLAFMQRGPSKLPALSSLRSFVGAAKVNVFSKVASLEEVFIGEALEIAKQKKHTSNTILKYMHWIRHYHDLFNALYYPRELLKKSDDFRDEISRLINTLTDVHISKMLAFQSDTFFQFINEISTSNTVPDNTITRFNFTKNPAVVKLVREKVALLLKADFFLPNDCHLVVYFLSTLYKANPDLLEVPARLFEKNSAYCNIKDKIRDSFIAALAKKQSLTFQLWKQVVTNVQEANKVNPIAKLNMPGISR